MSDDDKQASQGFEAQPTVPELEASDLADAENLIAQAAATTPDDAGDDAVFNKAPPVEAELDDNQSLDPGDVAHVQRKRNPIIDEQEVLDEANELEPEETLSVGLTQEVQDHLDALSAVVLDSADVAARSATVATGLAGELRAASQLVDGALVKAALTSKIVLGVSASLLLVATGVFFAMSASLQSRMDQADNMLLAVGKRVVELNAGIEGINAMTRSLAQSGEQNAALLQAQTQLEESVKTALVESNALVTNLPKEAAKSIEAGNQSLVKQVGALDGQLKRQAGALASLGTEVKSLKGAVGQVEPLKRDVQALITLQKQRYLEALQQQSAGNKSDQVIVYPATAPPKKEVAPQ